MEIRLIWCKDIAKIVSWNSEYWIRVRIEKINLELISILA